MTDCSTSGCAGAFAFKMEASAVLCAVAAAYLASVLAGASLSTAMATVSQVQLAFQERDFLIREPALAGQLAELASSVACTALQLVKHWEAFTINRDIASNTVTQELADDFSGYARHAVKPAPLKTPLTGRKRCDWGCSACCWTMLAMTACTAVAADAGAPCTHRWQNSRHCQQNPCCRQTMQPIQDQQKGRRWLHAICCQGT